MNISLDKIAPPVAFVVIGSIMILIGGVEVIPIGSENIVINPPAVRTIIIVLGVILVLLGPFFVWREMASSKATNLDNPNSSPITDLSGIWSCNDKASYYVRQLGNRVFWLGERTPENPPFCNVAYGVISSDEVKLDWADIPKGRNRHFGNLVLKVTDNGTHLEAIHHERFGGSSWTKIRDKTPLG